MDALTTSKALICEIGGDSIKWKANMAAAEAILRAAHTEEPNNIDTLTCLGAVLCDRGMWGEALIFLEKAVRLGSTDRNTHFNLAVACINLKTHEEAMILFSKARDFTPSANTWESYFDPQSQ